MQINKFLKMWNYVFKKENWSFHPSITILYHSHTISIYLNMHGFRAVEDINVNYVYYCRFGVYNPQCHLNSG